ncbi:MAG: phosphotransferase [Clostridia bacterium]|nr:phosphotransferase [Clostridia bacterium]
MENGTENIRKILNRHGLSDSGLQKADAGFRNTVWLTDTAAVKIYGKDCGQGAAVERWIYREIRPSYAPELLGEGTDYIILRRIRGESLFHLWYQTDDRQRRQYIRQAGEIIRQLQKLTLPSEDLFTIPADWKQEMLDRMETRLTRLAAIPDSIPTDTARQVRQYITENSNVLDDTTLYPVYSDLHFDNLLVDGEGRMWLIDYEMMEAAPKDYLLDVWHRMLVHPFTYANEEDHVHTKTEDYTKITQWLREEVPELFTHPALQKRVQIYSLLYELDLLCDYPGAAWPLERIVHWLAEDVPV